MVKNSTVYTASCRLARATEGNPVSNNSNTKITTSKNAFKGLGIQLSDSALTQTDTHTHNDSLEMMGLRMSEGTLTFSFIPIKDPCT